MGADAFLFYSLFPLIFFMSSSNNYLYIICLFQVVALMGAHSLGMASKSNSGYQGIWTPGGQFSLDSEYYANMIDPNRTWQNKVGK